MNASSLIDTLLDRSIALGYGNVGLAVRRRLPGWPDDLPDMTGKAVLVTGAASGLGLAACQGFSSLGATVHALARSEARAADAVAMVREAVPGADVRPAACDVSSLREARAFADRFQQQESRLDVLVNNAGVMPEERSFSEDGRELMFATHVLAPFALTLWLAELLAAGTPGRVINVSSGGMYTERIPAGDLESAQVAYRPTKLYARTKREQVVITEELADRLAGTGIVVHSMHPGWVDTKGVQTWLPRFRVLTRPIIRNPAEGADTIVWLGAADEPLHGTGRFWHDRRPRPTRYRLGPGEEPAAAREALLRYCDDLIRRAGRGTQAGAHLGGHG